MRRYIARVRASISEINKEFLIFETNDGIDRVGLFAGSWDRVDGMIYFIDIDVDYEEA